MLPDPTLVAALRPEREFAGRWGIFSVEKNRWMEVIFGSEQEANESLKVLKSCKPATGNDRAAGRRTYGI